MNGSRMRFLNSGTSSKASSSPQTPLLKKQRRFIDESPLSQSEVSWLNETESQLSPQRPTSLRVKSSNELTQTPVRIVKRYMSSPAIGVKVKKVKNLFDLDDSLAEEYEEESQIKKEDICNLSSDEFDDFFDDQLKAVLEKVDEVEQLQKTSQHIKLSVQAASSEICFEDSFDDAVLASIPLEELSKCGNSNVEIVYNDGLSQIVSKTSSKTFVRNKSMQSSNNVPKRSLERHNSQPQLVSSTNGE
jgi:hypothetical protein